MSALPMQNPFYQSMRFESSRLHLAVTGSVSCYKAIDLLRSFVKINIKTTVTISEGARQFITPLLFKSLGASKVYGEMFDDEDVFAHLEPGNGANAMLVVPASANAIAKLASGCAGDMFSAQAVAFNGPMLVAPAMNPRMWANKATQANVATLHGRGCVIIAPATGACACGDEGQGRLAELPEIFLNTLKALSPQDMAGLNVMVTLGPTREPWDGVRFWSNPSSGRMGAALATCAWLRGANVTAICGPGVDIFLPGGIKRINVTNAMNMFASAESIWDDMNIGIFCAAVADFAPVRPNEADRIKIKKNDQPEALKMEFRKNPDILKTLAAKKTSGQRILGFAAEITSKIEDLAPLANLKLQSKNADIIAANRVNPDDGAFGSEFDSVLVVDKDGHEEIWTAQNKADIAWDLCSWLLRI